MQCAVCHAEVSAQSAFCNSCGAAIAAQAPADTAGYAPVGAGGGVPPPPIYATPPAYVAPPLATSSGLSEHAASAIAYITIIPAIVVLVLEPYNRIPLVKFHSWQSIGLCVGALALQIAVTILDLALHFIPGIFILFSLIHVAIVLGLFCLWLFVILKASKGEWYKLPVIGDFAEKQARS
jgi:uncharacterized membrane protein